VDRPRKHEYVGLPSYTIWIYGVGLHRYPVLQRVSDMEYCVRWVPVTCQCALAQL